MRILFTIIFFVICIWPAGSKLAAQCDSVKDIDGNAYSTVKIGKQLWLKENLKTTRFRDGSAIAESEDETVWNNSNRKHVSQWCYLRNDASYNGKYGKLYNWYAVTDQRNICPAGWHLPSADEYMALIDSYGGDTIAGIHLRSTSLLWRSFYDASAADNTSGFNALPGEFRDNFGNFIPPANNPDEIDGYYAVFWSATDGGGFDAKYMGLYYSYKNGYVSILNRGDGMSVRCTAD